MSQIIVRLMLNVIEIFFVTYLLKVAQNIRFKMQDLGICILLYLPAHFFLEESDWRKYIIKNIYILFVLIICLLKCGEEVKRFTPLICVLLSISEVLKVLAGFISAISMLFVSIEYISEQTIIDIALISFMGISVWILIHILKKNLDKVEFSVSKRCLAYFIYILAICIKIPFLYTGIEENRTIKAMIVVAICCTIIFLIISIIEKRNAEMERAKIEENNKNLSTKLHKSQEIIPAMVQVFSDVVENGGMEMEGQHARKLLAEMNDLFGQQLKENSKEDLQLKNFCSTGLKILDQQLKGYQIEASDRNVNFDIFVQAPINDIIKKDNIDQLKLQRAVGDLIRNAFRAMEREDKKCRANGHILLIIGCQYENILEIVVVDNGAAFPLHVIEAFGRRGVTTGGTGNGLADLVEFADETKASICVEEFAWETSSFTKKVSIIFDKRRKNKFISSRRELVKSSFWNNN